MGIANPRLMSSTLQMRRNGFFQTAHSSSLITHRSLLKGVCKDAKPVRANSRGFLNPWKKKQEREMASGRRGTATILNVLTFNDERWTKYPNVADSRLCRRQYYMVVKNRGLKSPRLFNFSSFRRLLSNELRAMSCELFYGLLFFCLKKLKALAHKTSCWTCFSICPRWRTIHCHIAARGEILKQVIRLRSSKTSYIFWIKVWSGWHRVTLLII